MKPKELKQMGDRELLQKLSDFMEELYKLRAQRATKQLQNPMRFRQVKKDIARVKTILYERGIVK